MSDVLTPASISELAEAIRSSERVLAVGNGTKPRLSEAPATRISMTGLQGICEYHPSEFTFTALAGTTLRELAETLGSRSQYLPFDPALLEAGATLGGTVAAGLSGPGRCRFGGLRDFILGARFLDATGQMLRVGGKVVKNAAGFDLPKFFVGSLGRFGVMTELTFKVFPAPPTTLTCRLFTENPAHATQVLLELSRARFEPDALDLPPNDSRVLVRLAGPAPALERMARDLVARWPGHVLAQEEAEPLWRVLREFSWAPPGGVLVKIPSTPAQLPAFFEALNLIEGGCAHISSGGNVMFVSVPGVAEARALSDRLTAFNLSGMTVRGCAPLWLGKPLQSGIVEAVKSALDPLGKFPGLKD
ncbi:MAG TPA: FAD-binding protein [Verrucomicrobiae bacterium]|nr:FAD-binding protein [Verrucomicrobiae bacterium]